MDCLIDGNRVRTTGPYDVRVVRALNRLEGMKRWTAQRSLSFENTPYNLEVWRATFPDAKIEGAPAPTPIAGPTVAADGLFDLPGTRPAFRFKTPPRAHQKAALAKLGHMPVSGLFMEVGTGKSWTAIALMGQRWCSGQIDRVLLTAPNGVHKQWAREQLPAHMSDAVQWRRFIFGPNTKKAKLEFEAFMKFDGLKILIVNLESLNTARATETVLRFLSGAGARTMMVVDESHRIKNGDAAVTKAAMKFGTLSKFRLIMTGTPLARDLEDKYAQFKFLDERILGHRYVTTFRNYYCEYMDSDYGPRLIGHKNLEEFYRRIDPYIFRIKTEEAYDLPPRNYVEKRFELSDEQLHHMTELRDQFFTEVGDDQTLFVKNSASLLMRLQQIGCGYLPMEEGFKKLPNPRLDELQRIIEQREGKIIVWCRFRQDVEWVAEVYGTRALKYYGPTKPSEREANIKAFMDAHSGRDILVASQAAAGTGLNLQGLCQTNIYYSNSFNAFDRWQSEGRTWRDGTTRPVTYFDLIARKSPDQTILSNLKKKRSLSDLVLDELRHLFEFEKEQ